MPTINLNEFQTISNPDDIPPTGVQLTEFQPFTSQIETPVDLTEFAPVEDGLADWGLDDIDIIGNTSFINNIAQLSRDALKTTDAAILAAAQGAQDVLVSTGQGLGSIATTLNRRIVNPTLRFFVDNPEQVFSEDSTALRAEIRKVLNTPLHIPGVTENVAAAQAELDRIRQTGGATSFFVSDLPSAIGQTGGFFLGGGAVTKTSSFLGLQALDPRLGAAILGAGVGASEFEQDALDNGADPAQVEVARVFGTAFGTLEAFGLTSVTSQSRILFSELVSRHLGEAAIRRGLRATRRVGLSSVLAATEEALQEAVTTVGLNITAADIAGYDPTRSWDENLLHATTTGGGAGFSISLLQSALGIRPRRAALQELQEILEERRASSDVSNILGPFTPLTDEDITLLEQVQQQERILNEVVRNRQRVEQSDFVTPEAQQHFTTPVIQSEAIKLTLMQVEADRKPRQRRQTIQQRFDAGENVVLQDFENAAAFNETLLQISQKVTGVDPQHLNRIRQVNRYKSNLQESVREITEQVQQQFLPNQKILVTGGSFLSALKLNHNIPNNFKNSYGTILTYDDVLVVGLNVDRITQASFSIDNQRFGNNTRSLLYNTLTNLLGRHVINQNFSEASPRVQNALQNEYQQWLQYQSASTVQDFLQTGINPGQSSIIRSNMEQRKITERIDKVLPFEHRDTLFSFDQFAAERLSQYLYNGVPSGAASASFFENSLDSLRRLYTNVGKTLRIPGTRRLEGTSDPFLLRNSVPGIVAETNALNLPVYRLNDQLTTSSAELSSTLSSSYISSQIRGNNIYFTVNAPEFDLNSREFSVDLSEMYTTQDPQKAATFLRNYVRRAGRIRGPQTRANVINNIRTQLAKTPDQKVNVRDFKLNPKFPVFSQFLRTLSTKNKLQERLQEITSPRNLLDQFMNIGQARSLGFSTDLFDQAHLTDLDTWNKFLSASINVLQLAQQNQHIQPLQQFRDTMNSAFARKLNIISEATERLDRWRALSARERRAVADSLYADQLRGAPGGRSLSAPPLSVEATTLITDIYADFNKIITDIQNILETQIQQEFLGNDVVMQQELTSLREEFSRLSQSDYFPLMRFGKYAIVERGTDDTVVNFETFETEREQQKALQRALPRARRRGHIVAATSLEDTTIALQGLPPSAVRRLISELDLSANQRDQLSILLLDSAPAQSFRKQFKRRQAIRGFSRDAERTYAAYMQNVSGHLSRLEFADTLRDQIRATQQSAREISLVTGTTNNKRVGIANDMQTTLDYFLNPGNEWTALRSAGFFVYLGFNVKSAAVNLTQIPLVTAPYLTAQYGLTNTVTQLTKAYAQATQYFTGVRVPTEISNIISRAIADNKIDQSLAINIAVAAEESNLGGRAGITNSKNFIRNLPRYSAYMFHIVEKFNRATTLIAAYNLSRARGQSIDSSYSSAVEAVDSTQFEYSRWARPRFMRGKQSVLLLFFNYLQNILFRLSAGGPGGFLTFLTLMSAAGLLGLPFAEDFLDIVDYLGTKYKERTGAKDPVVQSRIMLRDSLHELNVNPDLILHGASRSSFGLGAAGRATGLPIPDVDLSGSLSLGNLLPTQFLNDYDRNFNDSVTSAIADSGAAQSYFLNFLRAATDEDPDNFKRLEAINTRAGASLHKAIRIASEGRERTRRGETIADFELDNPVHQMELLAQALGFTPTRISEGWEERIARRTAVNYYSARSRKLIDQLTFHVDNKETEEAALVRKSIKTYNNSVPFPELRITGRRITQALKDRRRRRVRGERDLAELRRNRRLSQSIGESFEP